MSGRLFLLFAIFAVVAGFAFTTLNQQSNTTLFDSNFTSDLNPLALIQELADKEILTPPPLRGSMTGPASSLTIDGILRETNKHRAQAGLEPLTLNPLLNQAAERKVADMFAQQYFEHVSPTGVTPAQLVDDTGYSYLQTGENLALGNYPSEAALVQAWMDSPGHRENILKPGYNEIGLAASPGTFENHRTWLAVQTFATSAATCPLPNTNTQSNIEAELTQLSSLNSNLEEQRTTLDKLTTELSDLVDEVNQLSTDANTKIEAGNAEIVKGNEVAATGDQETAQAHWDKGEQLQAESQALRDTANTKRAELDMKNSQLDQLREAYNSDAASFNELNEELRTRAEEINVQIRAYNACVNALKA